MHGVSSMMMMISIIIIIIIIVPWSKILEKLTGAQAATKFRAFHITFLYITMFTTTCH
jgi:hypothetical protein